jgi:uncharacterized protein YdhG (YjbR/CyaY superfamily)
MEPTKFKSVDEYFSAFPAGTKSILGKLRAAIKDVVPQAEEVISYNMPAFKQNGMLVWYAANKQHIGFYPTPEPIRTFAHELRKYKTSKGAIQFPIDKPIPISLVKRIVRHRVKQNLEKARAKELR